MIYIRDFTMMERNFSALGVRVDRDMMDYELVNWIRDALKIFHMPYFRFGNVELNRGWELSRYGIREVSVSLNQFRPKSGAKGFEGRYVSFAYETDWWRWSFRLQP
jgi:hypothetical protein